MRISGAEAVDNVATELRELRQALNAPLSIESGEIGPTTPQRFTSAIKIVQEDDEISDNEKAQIIKLFRKNQVVADAYTAIDGQKLRRIYIRSELDY